MVKLDCNWFANKMQGLELTLHANKWRNCSVNLLLNVFRLDCSRLDIFSDWKKNCSFYFLVLALLIYVFMRTTATGL